MKLPEDVRRALARRFQNKHREWLTDRIGEKHWPLEIPLGLPTEQAALRQIDGMRAWLDIWQRWQGSGTLSWRERRWNSLGVQRLPEKLVLRGPEDLAQWIGQASRWQQASRRYQILITRWPALASRLPRFFDVLADYGETDFQRLTQMIDWIRAHPDSNLYPRQLPVAGADSKWLESRKGLIADLIAALRHDSSNDPDFYRCCGLRPPPQLIRMRILDPELKKRLGGLGDISAPHEEVARLDIRPRNVFIVENLQTGLAFDDLAETVVIMGLGYAVDILARLAWLQSARCLYWGDIDTHGFAILDRARKHIPGLESLLMDEPTLMLHRDLWVEEKNQHPATDLSLLNHPERQLYRALQANIHGQQLRLEQERVRWDNAWPTIQESIR